MATKPRAASAADSSNEVDPYRDNPLDHPDVRPLTQNADAIRAAGITNGMSPHEQARRLRVAAGLPPPTIGRPGGGQGREPA